MITFVDHVGRTVIGEEVEQNETTLTVNNPVIIYVEPDPQTGQLKVQSFPYLFFEFLDVSKKEQNNWTFNKSAIAVSDCVLNDRIATQYKAINNPQQQPVMPQQQSQAEPEIIKLFSDD